MHLQDVIPLVLLQVMEKKRTFKHIKANNSYEEAFCQLDQSWDISAELFQKLPEITCHIMYLATSVNDLQYQFFFVLDEKWWIPVNFTL